MTRKEFIRRFITVHKCVGCNEILDFEHSDTAYCDICRMGWNSALNVGCKSCFKPARECVCMPKKLKASGALVLRKLFFYDKENPSLPEIKLIYLMKKKKHTRITQFAAEQIIPVITEELDGLVTDMEQVTVTGVPRGERARRAYGFDHAELLARCIGKKLGIRYERLLCSRLSSKIQKKLDAGSREKNANTSIRLRKNVRLDGKYVILIDDMVTTGASMAACVLKLMSAGAVGVACFSMASKNKM